MKRVLLTLTLLAITFFASLALMAPVSQQTWPRPTLLGKSAVRGTAVSSTVFSGRRDHILTSGATHPDGVGD
jgi:hypothetical protein